MKPELPKLPPCPNCGRSEGAFMGSTRWGHDFPCCSEICGVAFAYSVRRWELELARAEAKADSATQQVRWYRAQLEEARRKHGTPK